MFKQKPAVQDINDLVRTISIISDYDCLTYATKLIVNAISITICAAVSSRIICKKSITPKPESTMGSIRELMRERRMKNIPAVSKKTNSAIIGTVSG